jgi:AsmA protein
VVTLALAMRHGGTPSNNDARPYGRWGVVSTILLDPQPAAVVMSAVMSTPVKILISLAGLALVLFVVLVIAVTVIFEPEDYRPYIVDAVEDATGRSFELQGELGLDIIPCCSVSLGASRLGNPGGFPDDNFASFESASASLKIWPLLMRREVQIGTVTLEGMDLSLVRLADGRANWEFDEADEPQPPAAETESDPAAFSVDAVVLRDGRVRYQDQQAGMAYTVTDIQVETGAIGYGGPQLPSFTLQAALTATDDSDGTAVRVELETELGMEGDRVTLQQPDLTMDGAGPAIPGGEATVTLRADRLVAALGAQTEISVAALTVDLRALSSRIHLTGDGRVGTEASDLQGDITLEQTSPRALLAALSEDPYQPADDSALSRLAGKGQWALTSSALMVQNLDVQLDDSRLTGSVGVADFETAAARFELALDRVDVDGYLPADDPAHAAVGVGGQSARESAPSGMEGAAEPTVVPLDALADVDVQGTLQIGTLQTSNVALSNVELSIASQGGTASTTLGAQGLNGSIKVDGRGNIAAAEPQIAGSLVLDGVSLRALLTALDSEPQTADPGVLSRLSGNAQWRLTPHTAAFDKMRWQLDGTEVTGSLQIDDFDELATRFDIALDRLNVDGYLAPDRPGAASEKEAEEEETEIPVELIRDLNLSGRLRAQELVMLDMTLRQVLAEVRAADGVLRLDPVTASLYGGQYKGSVIIDATGPTANLSLNQELAAVQVGEILQGFFDTDVLAGALSLQLAGSGAGNTPMDLLRRLAGDVSFNLSDGVYRGMDVVYELKRARALLKKEAAPEEPASKETAIRALKASGHMANGVLQTRELTAETSALRLLGQGGINLVDLTLDYQLNAEVLEAAASAAKLGDLVNTTIPLSIRGPLTAPKVAVDLKGLLTNTLRDTAQQRARDAVLKRLGVDDEAPASDTAQGGAGRTQEEAAKSTDKAEEPAEKPSTKDLLKRGLRDLLKPPPKSSDSEDPPSH